MKSLIAIAFIVFLLSGCLGVPQPGSSKELSVKEKHWSDVFERSFERIDCPKPRDPTTLPDGYYKGTLIDSHVHMLSLPDRETGSVFIGDNLGTTLSVDKWICMMNVEGTSKAFTFFPVWEPIIPESIDLVKQALEKYPGRFIPFIMPPDSDSSPNGYPTVDAQELEKMLNVKPGLFKGYGEIGLYARDGGAKALAPDSQRLTDIYPIIRKHVLVMYFHPGFNQKEALERAAQANRDITFVFHGGHLYVIPKNQAGISHDPKILSDIEEILYNNPNIYYGVDELYGGDWLLQPGKSKDEFLANFADYASLLETDVAMFKGFIERHPDQVMWGSDRGVSASWDKDADVALALNDYVRAFIGKLDPSVQEKFASENAEKIFAD